MNYFSDKDYTRCVHLLRKIIKSIIPITDQAKIEDYVHDCILFLVKKRQDDPNCELKTSYLKHLAIKMCVDSVRSKASNIKYYCSVCGHFYNRKELAIDCHKDIKDFRRNTHVLTFKRGGNDTYGVNYNEISLEALSNNEESNEDFDKSIENPLNFLEKQDFFEQFMSLLSENERKIVQYLLEGVNSKRIKEYLKLQNYEYLKAIKAIRFTYNWLEAKSQ